MKLKIFPASPEFIFHLVRTIHYNNLPQDKVLGNSVRWWWNEDFIETIECAIHFLHPLHLQQYCIICDIVPANKPIARHFINWIFCQNQNSPKHNLHFCIEPETWDFSPDLDFHIDDSDIPTRWLIPKNESNQNYILAAPQSTIKLQSRELIWTNVFHVISFIMSVLCCAEAYSSVL